MRILLAPREIAGQMETLARGLRRLGHEALAVNYYGDASRPSGHVSLGFESGNRDIRRAVKTGTFASWAMTHFDVFHFFFGESLLPRHRDLPLLRALGKRIVVHFRGSDVIRREYGLTKDGRSDPVIEDLAPSSSGKQQASIRRWRKWADHLLVSTPDLRRAVPDAHLVPQAIDLASLPQPSPPPPPGSPLKVVHAPSNRAKKGTDHVIYAVEQLQKDGMGVTLELLEGRTHGEVLEAFATCDIGVDQLLSGAYGNVSVELMALGKPVICRVDRATQGAYPDSPIVATEADDLTETLRSLAVDVGKRIELGALGIEFVRRHHDVNTIADRLVRHFYSSGQ